VNKYIFSLVFLLTAFTVAAQKKPAGKPTTKPTFVQLIKSQTMHTITLNGKSTTKVYQGVFQQDNSTFRSDSAYFYQEDNALDAFGHVVITQGDTLHIFSDKLNYNGNTKTAILTDNVKMIDKDATLTTNYFTYNTGTRYGTYTGGGKLVNKENTLISKNGYYFAFTRDAYFRYDVVLTTSDAVIKTDTLRYNSGTRIAYFYGPTNIYGKDKDTLYTERGTYNTQTEQAFFSEKNLYKKGTRQLVGDSLFYDRLKGYGKATKHVTFTDKEQKVIIKGGLGVYTKDDERMVMTVHPYVVLVVEDSVKKDTTAAKNKTLANANKGLVNSRPIRPDTAAANYKPQLKIDSAAIAKIKPQPLKPGKNPKKAPVGKIANNELKTPDLRSPALLKTDAPKVKRDSIYLSGDTIETQIITYQELKYMQESRRLAGLKDSTLKATVSVVYTKVPKHLDLEPPHYFNNKDYLHPDYFPKKIVPLDTSQKAKAKRLAKLKAAASVRTKVDSVYMTQKVKLSDTSRVRILIAAHHAKIFKTDLQAVADSIFFTYADSIARMYVHPMIWSDGSQLSGDTVHLQLKNKKVDNVEMFPSAFIVNVEKKDSTHFNQIAGRKMRGFFKNNKINVVYVDGNAQTLYYDRDSTKISQISRTVSSRIRVNFNKTNNLDVITWYDQYQDRLIPLGKLKEDDKILKGFLWKPKDRPVSKEAVINPPPDTTNKKSAKKLTLKKGATDKTPPLKPEVKPVSKPVGIINSKTDSLKAKGDAFKKVAPKPDTSKRNNLKPDTSKIK
jgi:lipopolysaccharide export system protein LptA